MLWAKPAQSHHCPNTTLSVLSLCNTEVQSPHLLAIGSDLGTVDIVNLEQRSSVVAFNSLHDFKVNDIGFLSKDILLSFDKEKLIYLDINAMSPSVIYDQPSPLQSLTFSSNSSLIIGSTTDNILSFDTRMQNPTTLIEQNSITELSLLPDNNTLFGLQYKSLSVTDIRRPDKFYSLEVNIKFEKLACNDHYLAAVTEDCQLYSFELPFSPLLMKNLIPFENPFLFRPAFINDYITIGTRDGIIFILDPETDNIDLIQSPIETPIVSIASNESEIAVSFEDDIYVFSHFPWEDNLLRPREGIDDDFDFLEEEDEQKAEWLSQSQDIKIESGECTYERYGYCEQQVFSCYTCSRNEERPIGVCEQCALICHDGHDIIPIGSRRRFRCDCGNNRCPAPCRTMFDPKVSENTRNVYNHNFRNRWCICDGPDRPPMVQCVCCDEWFHHECIGFYTDKRCLILEENPCMSEYLFICNDCIDNKLTFLADMPDAIPPDEILDFVFELQADSGIQPGEGDPAKEACGFRILGGRWIQKDQFYSFAGKEKEFDEQFEKIDTTEEDKLLPPARLQSGYANFMKKAYEDIFRKVSDDGRTVIQKSDTQDVIFKNMSQLYMQRRRDQDFDDNDGGSLL
ncbi:hypothetical protein TRFO_42250 [Tritrichomonas foetus]|uniref:UBR-type domain-containing protein n=1 Tax=Tritrichomonas foetus TaxID=1144522 RepID=A0A1J4KX76_9EUKA|nr:hypothetical protein TRFO_42250 [Tritrichomonas foetus]|eukprot:OHT15839.1 hypothetical protein TRFO_42250 [Tritrichomonas foetus]